MEVLLFILAFLLGFSAGALVVFLRKNEPQKIAGEQTPVMDGALLTQYLNFMNYDGTERGQRGE